MTALRQAAKMALEALTEWKNFPKRESKAIAALKEALAQPEQEPVAWICKKNGKSWLAWNSTEHVPSFSTMEPLYLHPAPIPEGWQPVPKNPTDEMLDAAEEVKQYELGTPRMRWEAMLAAAPKPGDV